MKDYPESYIPYGRHCITEDDINSVVEVLKSQNLTQGPVVELFEQQVSHKVCAKHAVAVNSATSALHIACLALGLSPGDHLWTSPITFVASANCGRFCGAYVDFVDIDASSGLMSISALEQRLKRAKRNGTLPKILIPVHLAGASCHMKAIRNLSRLYNFSVIEDASHAIGGKYIDSAVGSCEYSDICVFSFHPVKIITTGEGGVATTNRLDLAQKMFQLRSHGIVRDPELFERRAAGPWVYEQQQLGFNYRITDLQAALGSSQLSRLDEIVAERNRLLRHYQELLVDLPVQLLEVPGDVLSAVHLAVIRLLHVTVDQHRQVFIGLRGAGIGVQLHYSPVHLQPYYRKFGFSEGQFPESEAYATTALSLPLFPGLTAADQERVVAELSQQLQLVQGELGQ